MEGWKAVELDFELTSVSLISLLICSDPRGQEVLHRKRSYSQRVQGQFLFVYTTPREASEGNDAPKLSPSSLPFLLLSLPSPLLAYTDILILEVSEINLLLTITFVSPLRLPLFALAAKQIFVGPLVSDALVLDFTENVW